MSALEFRPAEECRYDLVALGEIMLRLDPGNGRVATTRSFSVSEGGGEYNVARGLKRCFGLRTGLVSALADNPVGHLIEDLIYQGGVDQAHLDWREHDGTGWAVRNPLNFTERGFGVRGALGCSDRGHSAASQMKPGDVDWNRIFGVDGARWFHTGGVFSALSPGTRELAAEAMQAARSHGTVVSYDLNFRPSLWKHADVPAADVNRRLVQHADVVIGNEEDYSAALGYVLEGVDEDLLDLDAATYSGMLAQVLADFPGLAIAAATLRQVRMASVNDWSGVCRTRSSFHEGPRMAGLEIFDRIGGGDSFVSGLTYGLLEGFDLDAAPLAEQRSFPPGLVTPVPAVPAAARVAGSTRWIRLMGRIQAPGGYRIHHLSHFRHAIFPARRISGHLAPTPPAGNTPESAVHQHGSHPAERAQRRSTSDESWPSSACATASRPSCSPTNPG